MGRPRSKAGSQIKKKGGTKEENANQNSADQPPRKRGRPKKEEKTSDVKVNKNKKGAGITKSKETKRELVLGQGKRTKKEIANAALKNAETSKKLGKQAVGEDGMKKTRGRKGTTKVEISPIHEETAHTSTNGVQQTSAMDVKEEVPEEFNGADNKDHASDDTEVQKSTNEVEQISDMDVKGETSDGKATQIDEPPKKVGVHVSMSGGLHNAVENALSMDAKAFGLFLRNQRQWASKPLSDEDADKFKKACIDANYPPDVILPHGIYLMNCASPDDDALQKSRETLIDELKRCEKLGLKLYNFHPGSTCAKISVDEGIERIAKSINDAHRETKFVVTLIENMCCQGHTIGGKFEELKAIIDKVEDKSRIGVCFDTCHAHAAGYDMSGKEALDHTMDIFDEVIGMQYLKAVHLNDSKGACDCHLDRHENIGKGKIGIRGFKALMNDPRFNGIPMILETPETDYNQEIGKLYSLVQKS